MCLFLQKVVSINFNRSSNVKNTLISNLKCFLMVLGLFDQFLTIFILTLFTFVCLLCKLYIIVKCPMLYIYQQKNTVYFYISINGPSFLGSCCRHLTFGTIGYQQFVLAPGNWKMHFSWIWHDQIVQQVYPDVIMILPAAETFNFYGFMKICMRPWIGRYASWSISAVYPSKCAPPKTLFLFPESTRWDLSS